MKTMSITHLELLRKNYSPPSDFNFYFLMKVACRKSVSTGYLVKVIPEATAMQKNYPGIWLVAS